MKQFLLLFTLLPLITFCQVSHTVTPKETWYSIAREYSIPPREIAAYNNLTIENGLTIGQVIKIPAKNKAGFPEKTSASSPVVPKPVVAASAQKSSPIYHKVEKKETLYHISKEFNVSIEDIRRWNNLSADGVSEGTDLVVGYSGGSNSGSSPDRNRTPVKKEVVVTESPVHSPVAGSDENHVKSLPSENKTTASTETSHSVTPVSKSEEGKAFSGGFFKTMYDDQASKKKNIVEETGTAAIFKSTSGWEDGKYYCLHNSAPSGSFIKITNKVTQKFVYAKVLDVIPDLKQNTGIVLRLSNAAASELGAGEANFDVVLNY